MGGPSTPARIADIGSLRAFAFDPEPRKIREPGAFFTARGQNRLPVRWRHFVSHMSEHDADRRGGRPLAPAIGVSYR